MLSVAIWDREEAFAFDYHEGCYALRITGDKNVNKELTRIPMKYKRGPFCFGGVKSLAFGKRVEPKLNSLSGTMHPSPGNRGLRVKLFELLDGRGRSKDVFFTGEAARAVFSFNRPVAGAHSFVWMGVYRKDGIYCQGLTSQAQGKDSFSVVVPSLLFYPDITIFLLVSGMHGKRDLFFIAAMRTHSLSTLTGVTMERFI